MIAVVLRSVMVLVASLMVVVMLEEDDNWCFCADVMVV